MYWPRRLAGEYGFGTPAIGRGAFSPSDESLPQNVAEFGWWVKHLRKYGLNNGQFQSLLNMLVVGRAKPQRRLGIAPIEIEDREGDQCSSYAPTVCGDV